MKTLELMNGAAIVPALIMIGLMVRYLVKEKHRRGIVGLDWLHYPPSMNLILAFLVFAVAVEGDRTIKWAWRFFGAGELEVVERVGLIFFGSLIVVGALCTIRALTKPDLGDRPWVISTVISGIAIVVLLIFR